MTQRFQLDAVRAAVADQPLRHFVAEGLVSGFQLNDADLAKQDRAELIALAKQGKIDSLSLTINASNNQPNKKFAKFLPEQYGAFAETFGGTPFLRDHKREYEAQGGAILKGWSLDDGNGLLTMRQELVANDDWSILGFLTKKINRFSIGWDCDEVLCSICDKEMQLFHEHAAGSWYDAKGKRGRNGDGKLCEAVMVNPVGTETSAVVIPACKGTGVVVGLSDGSSSIYSLGELFARPEVGRVEGGKMIEHLREILGLAKDAEEGAVITAVAELSKRQAELAATLSRVTEKLALPAGTEQTGILAALLQVGSPANFVPIAEHKAALEANRKMNASHRVELLMRDGVFSPAEQEYAIGHCLSDENAFEAWAATKPKSVPIGGSPPPRPSEKGGTLTQEEREVNRRMGVTDENYLKQRDEDRKKFGR